MKMIPIIALAMWTLGLTATETRGRLQSSAIKRQEKGMTLSVFSNKNTYVRSDSIKLHVMLTNLQNDDTFVYGTLDWGYSASLTIHVRDAMGRTIKPSFLDDALSPPLPRDDKSVFVRLASGHFLGTHYSSTLRHLGIAKPGRYSLFVEYRAPYSAAQAGVRPFFGSENGVIRSNPVQIEVRR